MTTVSLVSFSGAPGVSTLALATAAALTGLDVAEPVLVELATSGGVVGGWYDLPAEPGLSTLALGIGGEEPPELLANAQELPGGLAAVVAPPSGSRVAKLLAARGQAMASYLQAVDATVVADCGRIAVDTSLRPVLEASILVGVVVRPTREDFRLAATALAELNTVASGPLPAGWILAGPSPWSIDEIGSQYGLPVLATLPDDRSGAEAVAGRRRFRRHAPLPRSARSFADDIAKHIRVAPVSDPLGYLHQPPLDDAEPLDDPAVDDAALLDDPAVDDEAPAVDDEAPAVDDEAPAVDDAEPSGDPAAAEPLPSGDPERGAEPLPSGDPERGAEPLPSGDPEPPAEPVRVFDPLPSGDSPAPVEPHAPTVPAPPVEPMTGTTASEAS